MQSWQNRPGIRLFTLFLSAQVSARFLGIGETKARQAIVHFDEGMVDVIDDGSCPDPTTGDAEAIRAWKQANSKLNSILFFTTQGSALVTVKHFKEDSGTRTQDEGQGAWKVLAERFEGNTKETRRASRNKLFNTVMQSGTDPVNFLLDLGGGKAET